MGGQSHSDDQIGSYLPFLSSLDWVFIFAQMSSAMRAVRYLDTDPLVSWFCRRQYEDMVIIVELQTEIGSKRELRRPSADLSRVCLPNQDIETVTFPSKLRMTFWATSPNSTLPVGERRRPTRNM